VTRWFRQLPRIIGKIHGGDELLRVFGLLILDSIQLQLSQGKCSIERDTRRPTGEGHEGSGPLSAKQRRQIMGLILVWFKHVWPALKGGRAADGALSYSAVIRQCKSPDVLAELLELIPPFDERPLSEFSWISHIFTKLHTRGSRGDRTAGNHVDEALLFLLWRIEQIASRLGLKITDLLPELAEADTLLPSIAPDVNPSWAARLATCAADYRSYELRQIEALLAKQRLDTSFEWFLPRQVCRPAMPAGDGQFPRVACLPDICRPEARTALLEQRGIGITTALLWLSNRYCANMGEVEPIVLRLDALEYSRFSLAESPFGFLARRIYGSDRNSLSQRQAFEDTLSKAKVICLVDNLAWLPLEEDRIRIGRRLSLFSGAVFTVPPGISSESLMNIDCKETVLAELAALDGDQIHAFITVFASRCSPGFDMAVARHIAQLEFPGLASFPLGLSIICEQVRDHQSSAAQIVARLFRELFNAEEMPLPQWHQECSYLVQLLQAWFRSGGTTA